MFLLCNRDLFSGCFTPPRIVFNPHPQCGLHPPKNFNTPKESNFMYQKKQTIAPLPPKKILEPFQQKYENPSLCINMMKLCPQVVTLLYYRAYFDAMMHNLHLSNKKSTNFTVCLSVAVRD